MKKEERKKISKSYKKEYKRKPIPKIHKGDEKGNTEKEKNSGIKGNFLYKSSRTLFFYKWVLPIIGIMIVIVGASKLVVTPNLVRDDWRNGAPVVIIWLAFLLIVLMFRLRKVIVYSYGIRIKKLLGAKFISFDEIDWVSQTVMTKLSLIRIKYHDKNGRHKRISTIPQIKLKKENAILFSEDEMTIYIRKRIKDANPTYNKSIEPKRWTPFIWIISVPVFTIFVAKVWSFDWLFEIFTK